MTIVAGFNFDDGILICGDTKHTGNTVHHRSKIHTKTYPSGARSIFALAGRSPLARMAIDKCELAIASKFDPTLEEMEEAIVDVLIDIHQKHVFKHPLKGYSGGPDFNLIVGLWSPHSGVKLYITEETALDHVPTFHCWGTGEYLGRYIIEPRYPGPQADLNKVIFTAITALGRIKKFDAECGGQSIFAVLRRDGNLGYAADFDITQSEKFSDTFFNMATPMYTMIADAPLSDADVNQYITWFIEGVNSSRKTLQTEKDRRESLIKALSGTAHKDKAVGE